MSEDVMDSPPDALPSSGGDAATGAVERRHGPRRHQDLEVQSLLEAMEEGVVLLDRSTRILFSNAAVERILGLSFADMVARTWVDPRWEVVRADGSPMPVAEYPASVALATGEPQRDVLVGVSRPDGTRSWITANAIPLREAGHPPDAVLVTFVDCTARRMAEVERETLLEELSRRNAELEAARRAADEASEVKTEFVATISHELRTPLSAILGFLQLILDGTVETRQQELEFLTRARSSGQRLLALINDVLDLTRIEAGRMDLELEVVDATAAAREVQLLQASVAQLRKIELALVEPPEPMRVVADAGRLKQVLTNLIGNALKFTPEGGRVTLRLTRRAEAVDFEVEDDGIGIPEDRLAVIFEKFVQAEGSTARRYGGSGLGLNISRQLVRLMNGELSVESVAGRGARFTFHLPAAP